MWERFEAAGLRKCFDEKKKCTHMCKIRWSDTLLYNILKSTIVISLMMMIMIMMMMMMLKPIIIEYHHYSLLHVFLHFTIAFE